jgi:inorganic pyrophosphatase
VTALDRLSPRSNGAEVRAIIETPQGSRNKLKFEPADEVFAVSASLPAGMSFPFDFGFIPGTRADDGDPLDVLVLMDGPVYPGTAVEIRLIGVLEAMESGPKGKMVRNDRLIGVAKDSTERGDLHRLADLAPKLMKQIESFFETYNRLEQKTFETRALRGPRRAKTLMRKAVISE